MELRSGVLSKIAGLNLSKRELTALMVIMDAELSGEEFKAISHMWAWGGEPLQYNHFFEAVHSLRARKLLLKSKLKVKPSLRNGAAR